MRLAPLLLLLFSAGSFAAPVTWNLDLTFDDGSKLTGTIAFDSEASLGSEWTDINIQTDWNSYNFDDLDWDDTYDWCGSCPNPAAPWDSRLAISSQDGPTFFYLVLPFQESFIGKTSGTIELYSNAREDIYGFLDPDGNTRYIVSGYATAVPIPAAAWLFGSALAGLGWIRRKQTV